MPTPKDEHKHHCPYCCEDWTCRFTYCQCGDLDSCLRCYVRGINGGSLVFRCKHHEPAPRKHHEPAPRQEQ